MKKFAALTATLTVFLLTVTITFAQQSPAPILGPTGEGFVKGDLETLPSLIITYLQYLAIILAIIYLMYGGIKLITAKGDTTAVQSARKHIFSAIVGLVVVLGVFVILQFVFRAFSIKNPLEGGLPTWNTVKGSPSSNR